MDDGMEFSSTPGQGMDTIYKERVADGRGAASCWRVSLFRLLASGADAMASSRLQAIIAAACQREPAAAVVAAAQSIGY